MLFLTARDGVDDRVGGLDVGGDDYLVKPFSFPELLARLRALTRRGPVERPTVLQVGSLRLDPAAHRVWRGDTEIELSAKEFTLLEVFMRRPGKALSRLELLERGWDMAYETRSNVVDVYVRYLREKIDRPFGCRLARDRARRRLPAARVRVMLKRIPIRWRLAVAFAVVDGGCSSSRSAPSSTSASTTRLRSSVDQALRAQSAEVARPPGRGLARSTPTRDESGTVAQVVAADGRIVRSDPASLSGRSRPETLAAARQRRCSARRSRSAPANGTAGARWPFPTARQVLVVARPLRQTEETLQPSVSRADRGGARRTASRDARGLPARGRGATSRRVDAAPRERDLGDHARRPAPGAAQSRRDPRPGG